MKLFEFDSNSFIETAAQCCWPDSVEKNGSGFFYLYYVVTVKISNFALSKSKEATKSLLEMMQQLRYASLKWLILLFISCCHSCMTEYNYF